MQSNTFNKLITGLTFLFLISFSISAQQGDPENGKKLFNTNCAACHKLEKKLIGPPLKGISEKRENAWLQAWIKDNNALRASGDQDAIDIYNEYNGMPMTPYPQLSEQDINDILAYTDDKPTETTASTTSQAATDPKVALGKKLFQTNCVACHKLDKKLIGPPLKGISEKRDKEWLHAWIKDNNALRASGDQDAIDIFNEYNGMPMTPYPQLTEDDIDAILAYTTVGDVKPVEAAATATTPNVATPKSSNKWMSYVLALVILILAIWIFVQSKNGFIKIVTTIFLLLLGTYILFDNLMEIGIDQGYQPIQPIAFSHTIHAGDNKIDCEYCHSSARNSKTSGIPSVNVCMNCHISITEYNGPVASESEKAFYDAEINKIYDAIGWDPEKLAYIENYEQKPIQWNRVHNLPDFVYYNHSQHVNVAGLECQECHGPVEEMDEVYQYSSLTMNWCLDCHIETNVDLKGNAYYAKIHDELAKKYELVEVTIADLGGKECGKCHY
ncbi:MAG: c-type cytochrome [Bacteroidota bacterium]